MKILLVDDSKTMRNIQKRTLAALPEAQFVEAGDGVEGLAAMAAAGPNGFQLVLVDWNMPNMDGITFVKKVRETDKATPMIMCRACSPVITKYNEKKIWAFLKYFSSN